MHNSLKNIFVAILFALSFSSLAATPAYPLKLASGKHYLVDQNNQPAFLQGEGAYSAFANLQYGEFDQYCSNRAAKGFNTILVNLIERKFCTNPPANAYGQLPFTNLLGGIYYDFGAINPQYFTNCDAFIRLAGKYGIQCIIFPCYLGFGGGSEGWYADMTVNTLSTLTNYGKFLANRYSGFTNIIWVGGGDYQAANFAYPDAVMSQLWINDPNHVITAHCSRGNSAFDCYTESWDQFNSTYTDPIVQTKSLSDYARSPVAPTFMIESYYEGEHSTTDLGCRQESWGSILCGCMGQLFGNSYIWQFTNGGGSNWRAQMDSLGSATQTNLANFVSGRNWWNWTPDSTHIVCTAGYGTLGSVSYISTAYEPNGNSIVSYIPVGSSVPTIQMSKISSPNNNALCRWFNPSNGVYTTIGTFATSGTRNFTPPSSSDYVLVIDPAPPTTYYISWTTGNDSTGVGSLGNPWKSYTNALAKMSPGDILLVQPGIYPQQGNTNGTPASGNNSLQLTLVGNPNYRTTLRANGPVTNLFQFEVKANYWMFDGFTWNGDNSGGILEERGSGNVIVTNCTFQFGANSGCIGAQNPTVGSFLPETAAGTNVYVNCVFKQLTNTTCIGTFGVSNYIQGCVFQDCAMQDSIRPLGSNTVIRLCTFTNMTVLPDGSFGGIYNNHPDITQVFSDNGDWAVNVLFEQNYVVNCPIQLMDWSFRSGGGQQPIGYLGGVVQTNNYCWGGTFRNNVFEDSVMQCSIDVPNVHFYNNTFRRCSNGGALLAFAFYDPFWYVGTNWQARGWATGGSAVNNIFIDCSGSYSAIPVGPFQGDLTNGTPVVKGHAGLNLDSGIWYIWGAYSNLSGTITSGILGGPGGDMYTVGATNFAGGIFNFTIQHTDPAGGVTYANQQSYYLNGVMTFRITTTAVPGGEVSTLLPAYTYNTASFYTNSGWNYKGIGGEVGGITGGATNMPSTNGWPATLAAPMLGAVTINAGTNLSSVGITNDFLGIPRPQGGAFDMGAFEYDPSLKVHYDFSINSSSNLFDLTGNTNHAWNLNTTNLWVYQTNGPNGTLAGGFQYVGRLVQTGDTLSNQFSQYGAITNFAGISKLTNATISVWAQIQTNGDAVMQLLDSGWYQNTNSWALGRDSTFNICFNVSTNGTNFEVINFPPNVVQGGGGSPNLSTTNLDLYTVTFDGPNHTAIGYLNGVQCQINSTVGAPYLQSYDYIALGALQHNGTPQFVDYPDIYPNAGFFVGRMADVRIYTRTLSATEVQNLYLGTQAAVASGGSSGPDPTIVTQPQSQTAYSGQTAVFTVSGGGTAPLSYQWKWFGTNVAGATQTSFTTPTLSTAHSGSQVSATVTNTLGSIQSATVTLTVKPDPNISVQPQSQTVIAGSTATFSVTADGASAISYQWKREGTNVTGATKSSYTTPPTSIGDNGEQIQVLVSDSNGGVNSSLVSLSVTNNGGGPPYYVAKSGSDSNSGTIASPFLTINKAAGLSTNGNTVFVEAGTYTEQVSITNNGVTLTNYLGQSVIIDGNNSIPASTNSALVVISAPGVTVGGVTIQRSHGIGISSTGSNSVINSCSVLSNNSNGIIIQGAGHYGKVMNCLVDGNSARNISGGAPNWDTGLSFARGGFYGLASNNIVRGNWGEGLSTFNSTGAVFVANTIYDNYAANLYVSDAAYVTCASNMIYCSSTNLGLYSQANNRGIQIGDETMSPSLHDITNLNCPAPVFKPR